MDQLRNGVRWLCRRLPVVPIAALLLPALAFAASQPLDVAGYMAFSYGSEIQAEPTGRQNESKVWWHDGRWWAILRSDGAAAYHIYRLDLGRQEWIDTGVAADDRQHARADVLWDSQSGKLYVASHYHTNSPGRRSADAEWARLYRYSYSGGQYQLDAGFPTIIAQHRTETMVLDKDSTGLLWVTFVSRESGSNQPLQVYVNTTNGPDDNWGEPFPLDFPGATVNIDDISSLIAFQDDEGPKIGVLWSNQEDDNFYFATHHDGAAPAAGWNVTNLGPVVGYPADDHISMVATEQGELFAAIKTETTLVGDVLIGVLARDPQGNFSFHPTSPTGSVDTRAVLVAHEQQRRVYVFTSSRTGGGRICMSVTDIVTPLADMSFPYEDCPSSDILPEDASALSHFIASTTYNRIDDPATAKHNATYDTGILVLAADDVNGKVYVYNHLDTPDPTSEPTPDPTPDPDPDNHRLYLPAVRR